MINKSRIRALSLAALVSGTLNAAEYFVNPRGADTNDGLSRASAFLTVQKGVDALQAGDLLTIAPGEYRESVRRTGLGSPEKDTVIRAEIPGTVVLRGDIPSPEFRPLAGHPFVYAADLAVTGEVVTVNELDTLKVFQRMPNVAELDFMPGMFHQDRAAGKLYLSTSDMAPAATHRYTVSMIPTHGIYLSNPRRVTLEGLATTGFNAVKELHYREGTMGGVWGMFLVNGKDCVIRDCRAWLNGWGIGLKSEASTSGDNVIERCAAWANTSPFWTGDMGGVTIFSGRRDTIRDSTAFLNGMYGINIYGTGTDGGTYGDKNVPGNEEQNRSRLLNNLAWGNWCDFKIKTGVDNFHVAERCVGLGLWSIPIGNVHRSLIGRAGRNWLRDSIVCGAETNLEADGEFADPANHDYRLQSTSRFRGKAPDGSDRGPYDYQTNVFYAGPEGTDTADGLSVSSVWKTLSRAVKSLRSGDTLYLQPGVYTGDVELSLRGEDGAPISIRGRGRQPAVIVGAVRVRGSHAMNFTRLHFAGPVILSAPALATPEPSSGGATIDPPVTFENCQFTGGGVAVAATGWHGLRVTHCVFTGFKQAALDLKDCSNVHLSGNLYDNRKGVALRMDRVDGMAYSDYNSYRRAATACSTGNRTLSLADLQAGFLPAGAGQDHYSQTLVPEWHVVQGVAVLKNPLAFATLGPLGKPIGLYRDEGRLEPVHLVAKPTVHSVSATTANLEWMVSLPAACELEWGETPGDTHTKTFNVDHFGTFSLTGLKPGHTYHFNIRSLRAPDAMTEEGGATRTELKDDPLTFTILKEDKAPAVYYVAPDGNDANTGLTRQRAWKTVQHAASTVKAGDTVRIAGGTYPERVRIRATGESQAPITFTCMPGEKVVMSGAGKTLSNAFIVAGKSHLRFDALYFSDFNFDPSHGCPVGLAGDFNLYSSRDIRITRCFSDGRGGYTARSITAWQVEDLLVGNCVNLNKMSGALDIARCPNLRLEHNVFARPMINSFVLNNTADQKAVMEHNIFTDMLEKKAALNASFAELEEPASLQLKDNCFALRCFPPDKRIVFADVDHSIHKVTRTFTLPEWDSDRGDTRTLFADPAFAGDPGHAGNAADKSGFSPERMMESTLALDFDSFFATNPEVIKRGIGLQPEAFKDFSFERKQPTGK